MQRKLNHTAILICKDFIYSSLKFNGTLDKNLQILYNCFCDANGTDRKPFRKIHMDLDMLHGLINAMFCNQVVENIENHKKIINDITYILEFFIDNYEKMDNLNIDLRNYLINALICTYINF